MFFDFFLVFVELFDLDRKFFHDLRIVIGNRSQPVCDPDKIIKG